MRGSISFEHLGWKGKALIFVEMQNKRPQRQRALSEATGQCKSPERRSEWNMCQGAGEGLGLAARRGMEGGLVQQLDADRYCTTLFQRLIRPVSAVPLRITHFPAVHAFATLTLKSAGTLTC